MSNVQRYYLGKYGLVEGEALGRLSVVLAADFDRVTAERDALQERLNAADQKDDDLTFQLNDREASRYDWLQAAQAAEKRVEALEGLLREVLELIDDGVGRSDFEWKLIQKLRIALSASAEPSAPVEIGALLKEAERYRWLRDKAGASYGTIVGSDDETPEEKDAIVDEGMARAALELKP